MGILLLFMIISTCRIVSVNWMGTTSAVRNMSSTTPGRASVEAFFQRRREAQEGMIP